MSTDPVASARLVRDGAGFARAEVTLPVRGTFSLRWQEVTPDKHAIRKSELLLDGALWSMSYCWHDDDDAWSWHGTPFVEGYQYRVNIDTHGTVTFWDRPAPVFFGDNGDRIP